MQLLRTRDTRPPLASLCLGALLLVAGLGCQEEDVGAPCNHGQVEPPESKLVTFPALSCNDLLCIYADEDEPPAGNCNGDDSFCNKSADLSVQKFQCVVDSCELRVSYVLERSMCSKKCSDDKDCKNSGNDKVVVENTECVDGFSCARIQSLGKFCCEKLCVCNDDLGPNGDLDTNCAAATQDGCCIVNSLPADPMPTACGKP
jgi:hypothetical protein